MLLKCKKFGPISWTGKISTKLIYTKITKKVISKSKLYAKKKTAKKSRHGATYHYGFPLSV